MPTNIIRTHPVTLETCEQRHAYLRALAESLIRNIDEPQTFLAAADCLQKAGLTEEAVLTKMKLEQRAPNLKLPSTETPAQEEQRQFILKTIELICEQIPYPSKGTQPFN